MSDPTIGEQELALLRTSPTADRSASARPRTSSERSRSRAIDGPDDDGAPAAEASARARGSTDGVYRYRARTSSAELMKGAVRRFVERNLEGSVSPFLAYLSEPGRVSDAELRELEAIVTRLGAGQRKDR